MRIRLLPLALLAACGGAKPAARPAATPPPSTPTAEAPHQQPQDPVLKPPVAERRVVTDTYHGVTVEDPYRWLENDEDKEVKEWSAGQNRFARFVLDRLPGLDTLRGEIRAIIAAPVTRYGGFKAAGGKLFGFRKQPEKEQAELIVMDRPEDPAAAKLILDPTAGGDATQTIDWFVPSPDGTKLAVSISVGGSESGTVHVLDLDGKDLDAPVPDVQYGGGGGDLAWRADGKGFWYTRYPAAGERPDEDRKFYIQVWWHELGQPRDKDRYELGKDLPKVSEYMLETDARGRLLVAVQEGDGGIFQHYLRDAKGKWTRISDWSDKIVAVEFGPTDDLWLVSRKEAPRGKVLRLKAGATLKKAKVVIPQGDDAIVTDYYDEFALTFAGDRLYLKYQLGGPSTIRAFTLAGKVAKGPALPPVSSAGEPVALDDGSLILYATSYTIPGMFYRYTPKTGAMAELAMLSPKPPVDLSEFEVHREMATSKDGAHVPYDVVWKKGAPQDGSQPCVVTGYGGYGIGQGPSFKAVQSVLLKRGVCFVQTNLRGGNEFGDEWHQQGMLTKKQNVFDDLAAVLDALVAQKYTSPERIVTIGGSNGGLLMGAMITQHPDKMKAVVSVAGVYDMLRSELTINGQYNMSEYGSVKDEAQFQALYAYSPYHHVTPGTKYPAVLFATGANDPRVEPWHSRKMTAALQAAQADPDAPILLRTSDSSGHGMGTAMSEQIDLIAHEWAFILWQLGVQP
jgi:prolyl oligopeptidase